MTEPRKAGFQVPIALLATDKTADVGKLMAEACRGIATMVTSTFTMVPNNYEVDILVTMKEVTDLD